MRKVLSAKRRHHHHRKLFGRVVSDQRQVDRSQGSNSGGSTQPNWLHRGYGRMAVEPTKPGGDTDQCGETLDRSRSHGRYSATTSRFLPSTDHEERTLYEDKGAF